MEELKKCPFCGSKIRKDGNIFDNADLLEVEE